MKRACPHPSSTETLSNWESASGPSGSARRTRRARPPCQVDGRDLGDAMARRGMASAYLRYLPQYMDAKVEARRAKRGICREDFIEPEEWRYRR